MPRLLVYWQRAMNSQDVGALSLRWGAGSHEEDVKALTKSYEAASFDTKMIY